MRSHSSRWPTHCTGTPTSTIGFGAAFAPFEEEQIVECIMICGLYRAVAYITNGLRVELEDMATRYPATP